MLSIPKALFWSHRVQSFRGQQGSGYEGRAEKNRVGAFGQPVRQAAQSPRLNWMRRGANAAGRRIELSAWELFSLLLSFAVVISCVILALIRALPDEIVFKDQQGFRWRLNEKSQALTEQINRNRDLEEQLRLRTSALESVMDDIKVLDFDTATPQAPRKNSGRSWFNFFGESSDKDQGGMGGGDERHAPIIRFGSSSVGKLESEPANLFDKLDLQIDRIKHIPTGMPVIGNISSGFGYRVSPFGDHRVQNHEGLDIAVDTRTSVIAPADGIVVNANYKGAYGQAIIIDHGNGIQTLYGHLSKISVKIGERVCRGQQIGLVGSTGHSTGPHLHYEVRVGGVPRDPAKFVELASILKFLS